MYEYVPNPLVQATLCLYLCAMALVLVTGRPTLPRAMLRLEVPWRLFLVALVLRFSTPPPAVLRRLLTLDASIHSRTVSAH